MALKEIFGANVRNYRRARELRQHQFADALEMSVNMVGKIERGVTAPSFDTIEKIAAVLEVPEVALFSLGPLTLPSGERGKLLQRIHVQLSKLNNDELGRANRMLKAFAD
jgi:transcriptional regulator with XRE-family HTH domain